RQNSGDALAHLPGRLVRERDRQDPARMNSPSDQVGDSVRDDTRLATTRPGQDEERPVPVKDRFLLNGVEPGEKGCDVGPGSRCARVRRRQRPRLGGVRMTDGPVTRTDSALRITAHGEPEYTGR